MNKKFISKRDFLNFFSLSEYFWFCNEIEKQEKIQNLKNSLNNKKETNFELNLEDLDEENADYLEQLINNLYDSQEDENYVNNFIKILEESDSEYLKNQFQIYNWMNSKLITFLKEKFEIDDINVFDHSKKFASNNEFSNKAFETILKKSTNNFLFFKPLFLFEENILVNPSAIIRYDNKIYVFEAKYSTTAKREDILNLIFLEKIFARNSFKVDNYFLIYVIKKFNNKNQVEFDINQFLPFFSKSPSKYSKLSEVFFYKYPTIHSTMYLLKWKEISDQYDSDSKLTNYFCKMRLGKPIFMTNFWDEEKLIQSYFFNVNVFLNKPTLSKSFKDKIFNDEIIQHENEEFYYQENNLSNFNWINIQKRDHPNILFNFLKIFYPKNQLDQLKKDFVRTESFENFVVKELQQDIYFDEIIKILQEFIKNKSYLKEIPKSFDVTKFSNNYNKVANFDKNLLKTILLELFPRLNMSGKVVKYEKVLNLLTDDFANSEKRELLKIKDKTYFDNPNWSYEKAVENELKNISKNEIEYYTNQANFLEYFLNQKQDQIPLIIFSEAEKKLNKLKKTKTKVYYDFESVQAPYCIMDGITPYTQVVTQISVIKVIDEKEVNECTNLVVDPRNISAADFEKIIDLIYVDKEEVLYVVYNKSFENSRLKEMACIINKEEYLKKVNYIISKTFDLADFFDYNKKWIILKDLKGFHSIKKVLELIPKDLLKKAQCVSYKDLEKIQNGSVCQAVTLKRLIKPLITQNDEIEWAQDCKNMKKYCENDVRAMIAVEYFVEYLIKHYPAYLVVQSIEKSKTKKAKS